MDSLWERLHLKTDMRAVNFTPSDCHIQEMWLQSSENSTARPGFYSDGLVSCSVGCGLGNVHSWELKIPSRVVYSAVHSSGESTLN